MESEKTIVNKVHYSKATGSDLFIQVGKIIFSNHGHEVFKVYACPFSGLMDNSKRKEQAAFNGFALAEVEVTCCQFSVLSDLPIFSCLIDGIENFPFAINKSSSCTAANVPEIPMIELAPFRRQGV